MRKPFVFNVNFVTVWKLIRKYILRRKALKRNFGLIRDEWDPRDRIYRIRKPGFEHPLTTDRANISQFPFRYDQGDLGSCVGNGICAAFRRVLQVNKMPDFDPSRLFAYYIAREDKDNDTGASIREGFKAINNFGLCSERSWPYITKRFAVRPDSLAYNEAMDHQAIQYQRIYPVTKEAITDAIYHGFPVVYGKQLYESFMTDDVAKTGIVPIPRTCLEELIGGHCMIAVDYDERGTIELNSWGEEWGERGVCHVPWEYILNSKLCSDFWVLFLTE